MSGHTLTFQMTQNLIVREIILWNYIHEQDIEKPLLGSIKLFKVIWKLAYAIQIINIS